MNASVYIRIYASDTTTKYKLALNDFKARIRMTSKYPFERNIIDCHSRARG